MPAASDPAVVVRTFLDRLGGDAQSATLLLDPDVVWRNTGLPTLRGERAIKMIGGGSNGGAFGVEIRVHHLAADGDIVLTDRTDVITVGRVETAFWVCGTFEVHDGRIVLWEDHFAAGNFLAGAARGVVGAIRGAVRR